MYIGEGRGCQVGDGFPGLGAQGTLLRFVIYGCNIVRIPPNLNQTLLVEYHVSFIFLSSGLNSFIH